MGDLDRAIKEIERLVKLNDKFHANEGKLLSRIMKLEKDQAEGYSEWWVERLLKENIRFRELGTWLHRVLWIDQEQPEEMDLLDNMMVLGLVLLAVTYFWFQRRSKRI